jgi:methyl-accepting chemotaxis protein WspA
VLNHVKLSVRLGGLFVVFLLGFAAFAWTTFGTVDEIKVNGPVYHRIVLDKDVVADILPPPNYIIESYLVVLQLLEATDDATISRLLERSKDLLDEYDARHAYWTDTLGEGPLRTALLVAAHGPAKDFFAIRDQEVLPRLRRAQDAADPAVAATLRAETRTVVRDRLAPLYEQHRVAIDEAVRLARASSTHHEREAAQILDRRQSVLRWLGLAIVALALVITAVVIGITNRLTRQLAVASAAASKVASGDLTVTVVGGGDDEAGRLLESIRTMAASLNSLVARVKQSSIQLMSTATEFSATSTQQDATITSFGAATTQIASAVREISVTSQELLATMDGIRTAATGAARLADDGRIGLASMDASMQQLDRASGSISNKLSVIREKASDINLVVTTITKVADQTNLLSVNAAIEAEKAGEHGLGFLVLAREIRRLADQTAVSTLDIEQMVRQMQSAVSAGVMEVDRFAEDVRQGVATVDRIGTQLGEIIARVGTISQRFDTVTEGMRAQSTGAKQINDAMLQLDEGARQTQASVRELNSATAHLRGAVEGLRTEISQFKVSA